MSRNVGSSETYPLIKTKDAAERLGVCPLTVLNYARDSRIPAVRIGRSWRFPANLLDRMTSLSAAGGSEKIGGPA